MNSDKKKIAINTVYLYFSSIFQLLVGLYTSRAILQALGVEDFGIYGVVGGIITFIGFINVAMSSASSRYITYELAQGTLVTQNKVFNTVFSVHLAIALITLLLGETVGLWYVANKLVVPENRIVATHWVYQMSILVALVNITQVPYNASITAHEKMGFASLWSSLNIFLKLIVILLLFISPIDRLMAYSFLLFLTSLFIAIGFRVYCKRNFKECRLRRLQDKSFFKEILVFASFNAFNSFSTAIRIQGTSLVLNKFFGVVINAANSVASMVSGYILGFTANIITAFRPQIIKCYASSDLEGMQDRIIQCVIYSLAIYSLMAVPIFLEMDYILKLWLGVVPQGSPLFCRITLIGSIFALLSMIMGSCIQATSKIGKNTIMSCIASCVAVAIMIGLFCLNFQSYFAFVILGLTEFTYFLISFLNLRELIPTINYGLLSKKIILTLGLMAIAVVPSFFLLNSLPESFFRTFGVTLLYCIAFGLLFFFIMLNGAMRKMIITKVLRTK